MEHTDKHVCPALTSIARSLIFWGWTRYDKGMTMKNIVYVACIDDGNDCGASTYVFRNEKDAVRWLWNDMYIKLEEYDNNDYNEMMVLRADIMKAFSVAYTKDNMDDARDLVCNFYDEYNCWIAKEIIYNNDMSDNYDYFDKLDEKKVLV